MARFMFPLVGLFLAGCVKTAVIDGQKVWASEWEKASSQIMRKVSFDLKCPEKDQVLTLLSAAERNPFYPLAVGVEGCGRRTRFQRLPGGEWITNTIVETPDGL